MSIGAATHHELNTIYGIEDCYDMIEVSVIDSHNRRVFAKARAQF